MCGDYYENNQAEHITDKTKMQGHVKCQKSLQIYKKRYLQIEWNICIYRLLFLHILMF